MPSSKGVKGGCKSLTSVLYFCGYPLPKSESRSTQPAGDQQIVIFHVYTAYFCPGLLVLVVSSQDGKLQTTMNISIQG